MITQQCREQENSKKEIEFGCEQRERAQNPKVVGSLASIICKTAALCVLLPSVVVCGVVTVGGGVDVWCCYCRWWWCYCRWWWCYCRWWCRCVVLSPSVQVLMNGVVNVCLSASLSVCVCCVSVLSVPLPLPRYTDDHRCIPGTNIYSSVKFVYQDNELMSSKMSDIKCQVSLSTSLLSFVQVFSTISRYHGLM